VRMQAARALLRADTTASKSAIPKLKELTRDESPDVRSVATQTVRLLEAKSEGLKNPKSLKGMPGTKPEKSP
jgi:HEAT repeat protein